MHKTQRHYRNHRLIIIGAALWHSSDGYCVVKAKSSRSQDVDGKLHPIWNWCDYLIMPWSQLNHLTKWRSCRLHLYWLTWNILLLKSGFSHINVTFISTIFWLLPAPTRYTLLIQTQLTFLLPQVLCKPIDTELITLLNVNKNSICIDWCLHLTGIVWQTFSLEPEARSIFNMWCVQGRSHFLVLPNYTLWIVRQRSLLQIGRGELPSYKKNESRFIHPNKPRW